MALLIGAAVVYELFGPHENQDPLNDSSTINSQSEYYTNWGNSDPSFQHIAGPEKDIWKSIDTQSVETIPINYNANPNPLGIQSSWLPQNPKPGDNILDQLEIGNIEPNEGPDFFLIGEKRLEGRHTFRWLWNKMVIEKDPSLNPAARQYPVQDIDKDLLFKTWGRWTTNTDIPPFWPIGRNLDRELELMAIEQWARRLRDALLLYPEYPINMRITFSDPAPIITEIAVGMTLFSATNNPTYLILTAAMGATEWVSPEHILNCIEGLGRNFPPHCNPIKATEYVRVIPIPQLSCLTVEQLHTWWPKPPHLRLF